MSAEKWFFCYICGWKKPAIQKYHKKINGKRRQICAGCLEDIEPLFQGRKTQEEIDARATELMKAK